MDKFKRDCIEQYVESIQKDLNSIRQLLNDPIVMLTQNDCGISKENFESLIENHSVYFVQGEIRDFRKAAKAQIVLMSLETGYKVIKNRYGKTNVTIENTDDVTFLRKYDTTL